MDNDEYVLKMCKRQCKDLSDYCGRIHYCKEAKIDEVDSLVDVSKHCPATCKNGKLCKITALWKQFSR